MIIEHGGLRVSVAAGAWDARFASGHALVGEAPAPAAARPGTKRAAVELHRRVGGLPQRALLGGTMRRSDGDRLTARVLTSGRIALDEAPACPGSFGRPLVPGLPEEFGGAVLAGLLRQARCAGSIVVDRAAYDPVESSAVAFDAAAVVLARVLALPDERDTEAAIRMTLDDLGGKRATAGPPGCV